MHASSYSYESVQLNKNESKHKYNKNSHETIIRIDKQRLIIKVLIFIFLLCFFLIWNYFFVLFLGNASTG